MGQRYVSAWDNGVRNLGGSWIKEGSRSKGDTLDSLMESDHVIRIDADGLVHDDVRNVYAPEINMSTDDDGQILQEHDDALIADLERQGWTVETGWTGQYGNHAKNPVMHTSGVHRRRARGAHPVDARLLGGLRGLRRLGGVPERLPHLQAVGPVRDLLRRFRGGPGAGLRRMGSHAPGGIGVRFTWYRKESAR